MWRTCVMQSLALGNMTHDDQQVTMEWNSIGDVLATTKMPTGYRLFHMSRQDVPLVTAGFRRWYPDVVVGEESLHLQEEFYYREMALAGESQQRDLLPIVTKHETEGLIAAITYKKDSLARTITGRLGAIAPEHRHSGLGLLGPMLLENIGRAIGAELAYYFATLKSRHQQVIAERQGYQLVGIVPGYDRDLVRPGEVKRVYEVIYAKLLVGAEHVHVPERENLTVRTRAVWKSLFGAEP
jgi:hypothetical protein